MFQFAKIREIRVKVFIRVHPRLFAIRNKQAIAHLCFICVHLWLKTLNPARMAHTRSTESTFSARKRSTSDVLRRVAVFLRPYPWLAVGTVAAAVLSLLASFAFPKLTQFAIDEVIGKSQGNLLAPAMIGLLAAFFLRDAFSGLRVLVNNQLEQSVIYDMRRAVYARLQRLPVGYFDQRASGDLLTRVIEDVTNAHFMSLRSGSSSTLPCRPPGMPPDWSGVSSIFLAPRPAAACRSIRVS